MAEQGVSPGSIVPDRCVRGPVHAISVLAVFVTRRKLCRRIARVSHHRATCATASGSNRIGNAIVARVRRTLLLARRVDIIQIIHRKRRPRWLRYALCRRRRDSNPLA